MINPGSICKRCSVQLGTAGVTLILASIVEPGTADQPVSAICLECLSPEERERRRVFFLEHCEVARTITRDQPLVPPKRGLA